MSTYGNVTISLVTLTSGEPAVVLEFDENDLSLVLSPAIAESIATNLLSAVAAAKDMGWERDDSDLIVVQPANSEPYKDSN